MAVQIIDTAIKTSVRTLLGVSEAELGDAAITDPVVGERAERDILAHVGDPAFADRPLDEQALIRTAIAMLTASYAIPTLKRASQITTEQYGDQYRVSRNPLAFSMDRWARDLAADAYREVSSLATRGERTIFTTAAGRRGA